MTRIYNVGDTVRCIQGTTEHEGEGLYGGVGWDEGMLFTIEHISGGEDSQILWSDTELNACGVYADWVEPANSPDQQDTSVLVVGLGTWELRHEEL